MAKGHKMKRYQIWIVHSILLLGLTFCILFAQVGCGENLNDESIYKERLVITFNNDSTEIFHGSNVRITGSTIYIDDCKEANNNKFYIEYYNVKYYYRENLED